MSKRLEKVEALSLTLHDDQVGVLAHFSGGKNILTFDPVFVERRRKNLTPLLSMRELIQPDFFAKPLIHSQQLPPLLSNLMPEGALRNWMANELKVDSYDEFPMLAWTGRDLPGALCASALAPDAIPDWALSPRDKVDAVRVPVSQTARKFSLAGVQMKFSSLRDGSRFAVSDASDGDSWIIKTPSVTHKGVVQNEYTAMLLAAAVGIDIPEVRLVPRKNLDDMPDIPMPDEPHVYAIKRFDRTPTGRVHAEDFAQIMGHYPLHKYDRVNYEQIGAAIYRAGEKGLKDTQQLARRLLVNILLANGDAHSKNWSMFYPTGSGPLLSPAYDIVFTQAYIDNDYLALNMAKNKQWYSMTMASFEAWAKRIDVPWSAIKIHLLDVMERARELWPTMLNDLPMLDEHKAKLRQHWRLLNQDFKIE